MATNHAEAIIISYLYEILDLSETLNFTETSRRMNLSQPSLSRHVSIVEKKLGLAIFKRSTNSVQLTPEGRIIIEGISASVAEFNRALKQAAQLSKTPSAHVTIGGGIRTPHVQSLIAAAKRMLSKETDLHLSVEYYSPHISGDLFELAKTSPYAALDKEAVDISVGVLEPGDEAAYTTIDWFDVELGFYAPDDSPYCEKDALDLVDLRSQSFVFPSAFTDFTAAFERQCKRRGFEPRIERRAVQYTGDSFAASDSNEVFVTFRNWYDSHQYAELLELVPLTMAETYRQTVRIIYRNDNQNDIVPDFCEALLKAAQEPFPRK